MQHIAPQIARYKDVLISSVNDRNIYAASRNFTNIYVKFSILGYIQDTNTIIKLVQRRRLVDDSA